MGMEPRLKSIRACPDEEAVPQAPQVADGGCHGSPCRMAHRVWVDAPVVSGKIAVVFEAPSAGRDWAGGQTFPLAHDA